MTINFKDRVAIVTGAGNGLGKEHALLLAKLGARVVVNDLGGARDGSGSSSEAAAEVADTIKSMGGEAISHGANVAMFDEVEDMVKNTIDAWGRVDVLVNNAGILRDKTFSKMSLEDFRLVLDVHLMGAVNCCKAVWQQMKSQNYGRIVMTTSASGMYGNFGQTNYGAAKMALIGLMNSLVIEGAKYNIKVNALAPAATTRMTEELMPKEVSGLMKPDLVSPGLVTLCHEDAPNRQILCAGAGGFAATHIYENSGVFIDPALLNAEAVLKRHDVIFSSEGNSELTQAADQSMKFLTQSMNHYGIPIPQ